MPALTVPPRVALDTSFVVEALLPKQKHHGVCSDALVTLAAVDSELVYSSLLESELLEATYRSTLIDRHKGHWKQARRDGRARARAARVGEEALEAWREIVRVFPSEQIDPSAVAGQVPDLMQAYALGSYDAVHVATAFHAGTQHMYVLDTGFARVPGTRLTLYTVSSKVPRMRGIRSGQIK